MSSNNYNALQYESWPISTYNALIVKFTSCECSYIWGSSGSRTLAGGANSGQPNFSNVAGQTCASEVHACRHGVWGSPFTFFMAKYAFSQFSKTEGPDILLNHSYGTLCIYI